MGCNCGGINRTLPKGIVRNTPGVFKTKPSVGQVITPRINPKYESIFTIINNSVDVLKYQESGVYFIGRNGSAECNYLRNLLPKIIAALPNYEKTKYFDIDFSKALGVKDLQPPTMLFVIKNNIYKSYRGIFDFKRVLEDFLSKV